MSVFQGYEGPARPATETATIYLEFGRMEGVHGYITKVDEKATMGWSTAAPLEVQVLPGTHDIGLLFGSGFKHANGTAKVNTEAGHTYEVLFGYADSSRSSVTWKVIDKGSGYTRSDEWAARARPQAGK